MVKDRVLREIGAKAPLKNWYAIDWKLATKRVRNLRGRIYRATQREQWNRVRSLMKLMLRSYSNLLLAVRRVTQINRGKRTAGIDGLTVTTPKERVELVNKWQEYQPWRVKPVKRVYIPKANGKLRPLGIPCISERVAQAIVKNALEPSWEARFEAHSYGFRPGRSCHDAIQQSWIRLQHGRDTWIFSADIQGAFDNICHNYLLETIGNVPGRELIKQWLKAGYVEFGVLHQTASGTPQGGIVSPLLANIALDGLEEVLNQFKHRQQVEIKSGKTAGQTRWKYPPIYGYIRYADDFIITAKTQEDILNIIPHVETWLSQRGLRLNSEKTQVVSIHDGFDFLGFNIRQFNGKCLPKPQREKVIAKLREIKAWLVAHPHVSPAAVIHYLNPILRGFANYYKHGIYREMFEYIDYRMFHMLFCWAWKRHPNKPKSWVLRHYFGRVTQDSLVFRTSLIDRNGKPRIAQIYRTRATPATRHIKVQGKASPDDPSLKAYWQYRQTRYGKSYFARGSFLYQIAQQQHWKCPICGDSLFNGEPIDTHHIVPIAKGGTDAISNRVHLHTTCHQQVHGRGRSLAFAEA